MHIPLNDPLDVDILMHRDAHFGGSFSVMLEYYRRGGRGANSDIEIQQIEELHAIEKARDVNLSEELLSAGDKQRVAKARQTYEQLKELCNSSKEPASMSSLIAHLILAEDEELPQAIAAVVAKKGAIVTLLLDMLRSTDLADPLFPGYGQAAMLAAQCLGQIGDKRGLLLLFSALDGASFAEEEILLESLRSLGEPARLFLLNLAKRSPPDSDSERAAAALSTFPLDAATANSCFDALCSLNITSQPLLATYLALCCQGLTDREKQNSFCHLAEDTTLPISLRRDMQVISREWSK